jgi:Icc protein
VKIIQISDTHLFAKDELEIFGVKSNHKFSEVMQKILDEDSHDTDMIFLTGDISQDETTESYQLIAKSLSSFNIPIFWLPGNHDNLVLADEVLQQAKSFNRVSKLALEKWHFIFLNTKIDSVNDGQLSQSELNMLSHELLECPEDKKIAIVMHHHPAPVNTPLIDNYILKNKDDFWKIITGTKVELVICGHVHGDYSFKYNNIMIESSPATCLQWEKGAKDLKFDMRTGYKIYHLNDNGYMATAKMW